MDKKTTYKGAPKQTRRAAYYKQYVYVLITHKKHCVRTFTTLKALAYKGRPNLTYQTLAEYFNKADKPTIYSNKRLTIYKQVLEKKLTKEQYFNYRLPKLKKASKIAKFKEAFKHFPWYVEH